MVKFATLQLGDEHLAEDAVQDALIGAFKNVENFAGRAAFKTWIFAILKNKIADILRKRHRYVEINNQDGEQDCDLESAFNARGHWIKSEAPHCWSNPDKHMENNQLWRVLELCLNNLPAQQGKVFMMREYMGLSSDEICELEGLSVSNLHVLLYRARLKLQKCLDKNWYAGGQHVEL
jgi:RNA polymerase sigma-70 factor (ECF subfamily)